MTPESVSPVQIPVMNSTPTYVHFPPAFLLRAHFSKWNHYLCNYSGHNHQLCIALIALSPLSMNHNSPTTKLIYHPVASVSNISSSSLPSPTGPSNKAQRAGRAPRAARREGRPRRRALHPDPDRRAPAPARPRRFLRSRLFLFLPPGPTPTSAPGARLRGSALSLLPRPSFPPLLLRCPAFLSLSSISLRAPGWEQFRRLPATPPPSLLPPHPSRRQPGGGCSGCRGPGPSSGTGGGCGGGGRNSGGKGAAAAAAVAAAAGAAAAPAASPALAFLFSAAGKFLAPVHVCA